MTDISKATPQWAMERHDDEDGSINYESWDYAPETYLRIYVVSDDGNPRAREQATLIVASANAHAELVAALREMLRVNLYSKMHGRREQQIVAEGLARAALAKAGAP